MSSSLPAELAATVQAAHIRTDPDPKLDIAPSTAAEKRVPVALESSRYSDIGDDGVDDEDEDEIPYSVLRPAPRKHNLPPLPDLRFEQSYLHSIANADTWWKVMLITMRDQVVMPLAQGLIYNLLLCGWQHWNRNARLHGNTVGARVRRWWYGVNDWRIPNRRSRVL
ncbi:hypothetical protein VFPFJ_05450 [Purpureocillium lilacinum]|uniref:DUF1770 domain-containing protein n=1 Tax=Purpureocillium lilacinum TaxID=33203 RepID=A0A179H2M4_PURLI|nr:hypothetical protein VFPFJ_05450 [Purpureocillium lilacinum]OAQ84506.1 hypothetical protein VFPBJ_03274 [Purpureocillium lilacinum]OAQ91291.1 hypothetical protein VFPFJ_05450 [Purpureocillium lilacinum]GJN68777.1 hypothetical protein PLICBS_002821 [Purpureocillium lilacinum]